MLIEFKVENVGDGADVGTISLKKFNFISFIEKYDRILIIGIINTNISK
jgi:hypothetical protein